MSTYKKLTAIALVLTSVAYSSVAFADDEVIPPNEDKIAERTRLFVVVYPDQTKESVMARYDGLVSKHVWQTGKPSEPFKGHPADDRACHWEIDGTVKRQLLFVSKSGIQAPYGIYEKIFDVSTSGGAGPKNIWQAAGFYHSPCTSNVGNYNNAISAAGQAVQASFDGIVAADTIKEADDIRDALKAVKVLPSGPAQKQ